MYCDFYQLRERPFNVTSDPKFLYLNACYREALASLNYGITQRRGFITLIGEAGTGKTTLLKKLMDDLDEKTRTVFIFNTNVSFDEMLEYIFHEFDLPTHNGKRLYMLQRLNTFLLEELGEGRNVALLIDEAQDLDYSVMEDLRLLSNLETAKEKILQIVLSGQPELGQKLGNPALRQLRQRVAINCRLQPLSSDELSEYIQARLTGAGCLDPKLFSRDAEAKIFEMSRGIPRLVNIVCDNALVIGYALGKKRLGGDIVTEAAADLFSSGELFGPDVVAAPARGEPEAPRPVPVPSRNRWAVSRIGMAVILLVAIVIGLLSIGRTLLGREEATNQPPVSRRPLEVVAPANRIETGLPASAQPQYVAPVVPAAPSGAEVRVAAPRPAAQPVQPEVPVAVAMGEAARRAASRTIEEKGTGMVASDPWAEGGLAAVESEEEVIRQDDAQVVPPVSAPEVAPRVDSREGAVEPLELADARAAAPVARLAMIPPEPAQAPAQPATAPLEPSRPVAMAPVAPRREPEPPASMPAVERQESMDLAALPSQRETGQPVILLDSEGLAPLPPPVEVAPETGQPSSEQWKLALPIGRTVNVNSGDSVSAIAVRQYGQATYTILDLLKMANPSIRDIDVISVGQRLNIPQLVEGMALLKDGSQHALLLLSSRDQRRVNSLGVALSRKGFRTEVRRTNFGRGRTVYRLLVPGFADRSQTLAAGRELKRLFREDDRIAALAW